MTEPVPVQKSPAPKKRLTVTLLIPTLNEIEGMKAIMPRVKREWCDQILILDGNSKDGTPEWAREQGYEVYSEKKRGLRNGYREVWAGPIRGDVVITFSPDGNCVPEVIPELIARMQEGYDMVIGSRYLGTAKSEDDTWLTGFGNWFFTSIVNVLHDGTYTDIMGIYRAYRTNLIHELDLYEHTAFEVPERWFNTHISWEPLLSVRCLRRNLKVTEVPAPEPPRIGGTAKVQVWRWGAVCCYWFLHELTWH